MKLAALAPLFCSVVGQVPLNDVNTIDNSASVSTVTASINDTASTSTGDMEGVNAGATRVTTAGPTQVPTLNQTMDATPKQTTAPFLSTQPSISTQPSVTPITTIHDPANTQDLETTTAANDVLELSLQTTPINDYCQDAIELNRGTTFPLKGSTINATYDSVTTCNGNHDGYQKGVWFTFLEENGVSADLCNSNFDTQMTIYKGSCNGSLDSLVCVAGSDDYCGRQSALAWSTEAGSRYYIYVHGYEDAAGQFELNLHWFSPPENGYPPQNDACEDAIEVKSSANGSTANATYDDIPTCDGNAYSFNQGVWYRVRGDGNAVRASLCNNDAFDSQLTVFEGSCGSLVCAGDLGGNDDYCGQQSAYSWHTEFGTSYYVYIHGYGIENGEFELTLQWFSPPINDACNDAIMIEIGNEPIQGSTTNATYDGISLCAGNDDSLQNGVWYTFYGDGNGVSASLCNTTQEAITNFDTQISIFEGSCSALVCVGGSDESCGHQSEFAWITQAGSKYHIYVHGYRDEVGEFELSLRSFATPENDVCNDSIELENGNQSVNGSTSHATYDDVHICTEDNESYQYGVWYNFRGNGYGVIASLCNSNFDTQLTIFEGSSCEDLLCIGGDNDSCGGWWVHTSVFAWTTKIDVDYYIYIHGYEDEVGEFELTLQWFSSPDNDVCQDATELKVGDLLILGHTIGASYDVNVNCDGYESGHGVWYMFSGDGNFAVLSLCNCAATFDVQMAVFEGDDCNNLVCIGGDYSPWDSRSEYGLLTKVGVRYYVYVHGQSNATGEFELLRQWYPPPVNDACENSIMLKIGGPPSAGYTIGATHDVIQRCAGNHYRMGPGVWYTLYGDGDAVTASLCNEATSYDTQISIFEGDCNNLICIGGNVDHCGDHSEYSWRTKVGVRYYIYVHGWFDDTGEFELSLEPFSLTAEKETEKQVLQELHTVFGGDWFEVGVDHCHWESISCEEESFYPPPIESIKLNELNLNGTIPTHIGMLSHLEVIEFYGNNLIGTLPTEIGLLTRLESLRLNDNALLGTLPSSIILVSNLRHLHLYNNAFTGSLPTQIGLLKDVTDMQLQSNYITGTLPSEIGMVNDLSLLNLADNALTGVLPSQIGQLTSLRTLNLNNNTFHGSLPSEIGELDPWRIINLNNNGFTGSLPSQIGQFTALAELYLNENAFTGSLPSQIGWLTSLQNLHMYGNALSGTLPTQTGRLSSIETLHLSNNVLTGSIPTHMGQLDNLWELDLQGNNFSGSLPSHIGLLSNLEVLRLSDNALTGSIPLAIGNLIKLEEFSIQYNALDGMLHIENLSNLIVLNVSHNQLSSFSITQGLPSIKTFDLSSNNILFEIRNDFFELLKNAQEIVLAHNRMIHGQLPNEVNGRLLNLLRLDIDGNCLSGELPMIYDIAMPRLEELKLSYGGSKCRVDRYSGWSTDYDESDASRNNEFCFRYEDCSRNSNTGRLCCGDAAELCTRFYKRSREEEACYYRLYRIGLWGSLPPSFGQFSSLRVLNLSNNILTGEIPGDLGNGLPRIEDINVSNNVFRGKIPAEIAGIGSISTRTPTISVGGNRFDDSHFAPLQLCLLEDNFDLYPDQSWCPRERNVLNYFYDGSKGQEWTNNSHWVDDYDSHCTWYGIVCDEDNISVKEMLLGSNGLSGRITRISELTSLVKLDLSDNDLKGHLPEDIGALIALSDLRLSYNSLTGEVPELRTLSNLSVLYLHSNRLQGEVSIALENVGRIVADCGSPSQFKEPLACPNCTYCCNYLGECDEIENGDMVFMLFAECGEGSEDPILGLHVNNCSIEEGAVFIFYTFVLCMSIWLLSFASSRIGIRLPGVNWQGMDVEGLIGEDSVYIFVLSSSFSGWFIAILVWAFQIYVFFLFVDASEKSLSNETDWVYRYRCARNAGNDENYCEDTTSITHIGVILGVIIMVINLLKDLLCGLKLLWIVPHRNESIQTRIRCLIGATLLFTVTAFAIYASVVYNQATGTKDTDFIYNSVVLIFLNSLDEWCFAVVRVLRPIWLERILSGIKNDAGAEARHLMIENIHKESEDMRKENQQIKIELEELKKEVKKEKKEKDDVMEQFIAEFKEMKKQNEDLQNKVDQLEQKIIASEIRYERRMSL